jgi:hypothetical protein
MELGFIRGDAGNFNGVPSTLRWEAAYSGPPPSPIDDDTRLARLPWFRFQQSPLFPGFLCRACRVVLFEYTDMVHQPFP